MKTHILTIVLLMCTAGLYAQNVGIGTATPDASAKLDVTSTNSGVLVPRIVLTNVTVAAPVTAPATGLLVWNTNAAIAGGNGAGFYYWNGTQWQQIGAGDHNTLDEAYDEGGAGAGRTIDAVDGTVAINGEDGLLVTGSIIGVGLAIGDPGGIPAGAGGRMFFYPRKRAFRSGYVSGTQWDDINVGNYSSATGLNTTASGLYSTAMGNSTMASGVNSTAMGYNTTAPSYAETVIGLFNTTYTPGSPQNWATSDRLFVVGNGWSAANRSNALTIYKDGTMNINDAYNMPTADGTAGQVMTTDGAGVVSFQTIGGNHNTLDMAYDEGGAGAGRTIDAVDGTVAINGEDGLLVTGSLGVGLAIGDPGGIPAGAGGRMFFYPRKRAFRSGFVNGTQWDDINVGNYSSATGYNTTASGQNSTAMGSSTTASGGNSTAMGYATTASGNYSTAMGNSTMASGLFSTAMGWNTTASGNYSTAMGRNTIARSGYETVIGAYNTNYVPANSTGWAISDRLFVVGNGTATTLSDAFVIKKNGDVGIATSNPTYTLHVNGTAGKPGGGSWAAASDARLKDNIIPYTDGLSQLLQINPVRYHYNKQSGNDTEVEYVGVIAQELQKVAPYMVGTFDLNGAEYLDVDNSAMTYMLINAVQEQQEMLNEHQDQIKALEEKLEQLIRSLEKE